MTTSTTIRKTVLVTGASTGNGKALADQFAMHGFDLVIVSQNQERLHGAENDIKAKYPNILVMSIVNDLTRETAPQELYDELKAKGIKIDILVNDAGVGQIGSFSEISLEKHLYIIRLNIEALTRMTQLFLPDMIARNSGKILNVGSVAGFEPGPRFAVYSASKAYVNSLSAALAHELRGTKVQVSVLCPGPIETPFIQKADMGNTFVIKNHIDIMQPDEMAAIAFKAFMRGKKTIIPGFMNKFAVFSARFLSRKLQSKIDGKLYSDQK